MRPQQQPGRPTSCPDVTAARFRARACRFHPLALSTEDYTARLRLTHAAGFFRRLGAATVLLMVKVVADRRLLAIIGCHDLRGHVVIALYAASTLSHSF